MKTMENLMAVAENASGIIGKMLYYSTSNLMIPKDKFIKIGQDMGLPKYKPSKESKSGAYRNATTAIKDRIEVKDGSGTHVYRVYCRDNKKEDATHIYRELVKETLGSRTNQYKKLANISFDKETETIYYDNEVYDADVDVSIYCRRAVELYERYCTCYFTDHMESVIQDQLVRMQANKINFHGNMYFIPQQYLPLLSLLEDYIAAIGKENLNSGLVKSNSMFVVDDDRQRKEMADEFYLNFRQDIEFYKQRVQHFIDGGCTSTAVINRWLQKISALEEKKKVYEEILKRKLDNLDSDYAMLQMQSNELLVRSVKGQTRLAA